LKSLSATEIEMPQFKFARTATALAACMMLLPSLAEAAPRHHHGGHHYRHHWSSGGYHHGWRNYGYYDNDAGAALAAGAIVGLAAGAIAANASAGSSAYAYCSQRFRSYDPASGTYLGYDGYRHPCP
jgi:hypothetical protein